MYQAYIKRFLITTVIATIIVFALSEGYYRWQREDTSRAPGVIQLVIPEGTAERVKKGQPVPSIPETMIFVMGDTLMVKNEDTVDHELGPLWIPPGTSASLVMEQANDYVYSCSFQSSKYLGLTVREAVTWKSRLAALWYGVPPMLMFLFIYSLLIFPLDRNEKDNDPEIARFKPEMGWRQFEGEDAASK